MRIADLLTPDSVIELKASDKRSVVVELARRAAASLGLDADNVAAALLAREALGSTGMGEGFALPHARLGEVKRPFGVFARLRKPVDFAAVDGRPVDLVFLLLLPAASEGGQLSALACVARQLRHARTARRLREASHRDAMFQELVAEPALVLPAADHGGET
jgi:PTS system nitrogen regulatory IIA component